MPTKPAHVSRKQVNDRIEEIVVSRRDELSDCPGEMAVDDALRGIVRDLQVYAEQVVIAAYDWGHAAATEGNWP